MSSSLSSSMPTVNYNNNKLSKPSATSNEYQQTSRQYQIKIYTQHDYNLIISGSKNKSKLGRAVSLDMGPPSHCPPPGRPKIGLMRDQNNLLAILVLIITTMTTIGLVHCQDFEDLNQGQNQNNFQRQGSGQFANFGNQQAQTLPAPFQPSRQAQSPAAAAPGAGQPSFPNNAIQVQQQQQQLAATTTTTTSTTNSRQRPVLSPRFNQAQQLSAQASTIGNGIVASSNQLPQVQPAASQQVSASASGSRRLETSLSGPETRQDLAPQQVAPRDEPIQSRTGAQFQQSSAPRAPPSDRDKQIESSETLLASSGGGGGGNQPAGQEQQSPGTGSTGPGTPDGRETTSGHETVYSDQRFANLFAGRRNNLRKKFMPTEQIKAKPTLPSFIRSPPDPKQFVGANSPEAGLDLRPITQASSNFATSARLQQQQQQQQSAAGAAAAAAASNQNRQNSALANSQKKAALAAAANSAASAIAAQNKRANGQLVNRPSSTSPSSSQQVKVGGSSANKLGAAGGSQANLANLASKPVTSNNPFSTRAQQLNNSDPANVIAMARRRLLANNAANQQRPAAATPAAAAAAPATANASAN